MHSLLETLIYLLAIMGIIFTTMSLFEIFNYKNICQNSYRFLKKNSMKDKRVEIVINVENLTQEEEEEILDILLTGDYTDINDIADSIKIETI